MPNLTIEKLVLLFFLSLCIDCMHNSASLLDAPIMLVGLTALSLDIRTRFETFLLIDAFATAKVPKTLFLTPAHMFSSTRDTCL